MNLRLFNTFRVLIFSNPVTIVVISVTVTHRSKQKGYGRVLQRSPAFPTTFISLSRALFSFSNSLNYSHVWSEDGAAEDKYGSD